MDLNVKLEKIKNEETSVALMVVSNSMNFIATPFRKIVELSAQILLVMVSSPIIICLYIFTSSVLELKKRKMKKSNFLPFLLFQKNDNL